MKGNAGEMIRVARMKAGMTQVELAKRLNVTQGTVGAWEVGIANPKPKNMVTLCEILKLDIGDLIKAG